MSIVKLNNRGVKNVTSFGSLTSGSMTFISKTTISSPVSSVQITSGIDSTYKEYIFLLVNLHPNSNSEPDIKINFSVDGGSNYNVAKTTTVFYADHNESGSSSGLQYLDIDLDDFENYVGKVGEAAGRGIDSAKEKVSGFFSGIFGSDSADPKESSGAQPVSKERKWNSFWPNLIALGFVIFW